MAYVNQRWGVLLSARQATSAVRQGVARQQFEDTWSRVHTQTSFIVISNQGFLCRGWAPSARCAKQGFVVQVWQGDGPGAEQILCGAQVRQRPGADSAEAEPMGICVARGLKGSGERSKGGKG